jgi:SAM-dependent methyltransferase
MPVPPLTGTSPMPDAAPRADADIAEAVRAFYERHPYPPPVDDLEHYRRHQELGRRRRFDAHLLWPGEHYREDRSILVAGCGTSQAAKYALRWPRAQVTAIDVSEASLRQTDTLKRKHQLDNLHLRCLPVERAHELGRTFEHVVCTGVLHHLPDPDAGLAALRAVMDRRGALHLMVYAPYGRAGVYLLQDYCRRLGVGSSSEEIAALVASLRALPQDHPFAALLRHAPDLQHPAGLADALLHPQDRAYSVPQLLEFLERGGFRFQRWIRQAPYLPHCGGLASSPHRPRIASLPLAEQFAAVELFRGTMIRHSAVACRGDEPGDEPLDRETEEESWLERVPVFNPDTIVVEERLPAGAAAVLINRTHTYTDLYLPVDARELKMAQSIDGIRTVSAIADAHGDRIAARALFQRLWWYDHVVFDASGGGAQAQSSAYRD